MNWIDVPLVPFSNDTQQATITASISASDALLAVKFILNGNLENFNIISFDRAEPTRRDNLWKETCFEVFISPHNTHKYWEVNLTPSGDWNVYRFSDYRSGMVREEAIRSLPTRTSWYGQELQVETTFDLDTLSKSEKSTLDIGVSSILAQKNGTRSYWAIKHAPSRPDFHWKGNFCLALPHQPSRQIATSRQSDAL